MLNGAHESRPLTTLQHPTRRFTIPQLEGTPKAPLPKLRESRSGVDERIWTRSPADVSSIFQLLTRLTAVVIASAFFIVALIIYLFAERRGRVAWPAEAGARVPAGAGLYRAGTVEAIGRRGRAPLTVRFAAFMCLCVGLLFVPLLTASIAGLSLFGLGLVLLPLVICTARIFSLGLALLANKPELATSTHAVARTTFWAGGLTGIAIVLASFAIVAASESHQAGLLLFFGPAFALCFAAGSAVCGFFLRWVAHRLDRTCTSADDTVPTRAA